MYFDLPSALHQKCRETLDADILSVEFVGGGDINQARLLKTSKGDFFIKINDAPFAFDMFQKEAQGLVLLKNAKAVRIPEIIAFDQAGSTAFLILEFIETG